MVSIELLSFRKPGSVSILSIASYVNIYFPSFDDYSLEYHAFFPLGVY